MKKILLNILLLFLLFTLSTCKKYPDGGFTRQGPKTFITDKAGVWQLALYEVNGIDSTFLLPEGTEVDQYYSTFMTCSKYSKYEKKGYYYCTASMFIYDLSFQNKNRLMAFTPKNNKYCIPFKTFTNFCFRELLCPESFSTTIWEIEKLRDKECVIRTNLKNTYKIILKR